VSGSNVVGRDYIRQVNNILPPAFVFEFLRYKEEGCIVVWIELREKKYSQLPARALQPIVDAASALAVGLDVWHESLLPNGDLRPISEFFRNVFNQNPTRLRDVTPVPWPPGTSHMGTSTADSGTRISGFATAIGHQGHDTFGQPLHETNRGTAESKKTRAKFEEALAPINQHVEGSRSTLRIADQSFCFAIGNIGQQDPYRNGKEEKGKGKKEEGEDVGDVGSQI